MTAHTNNHVDDERSPVLPARIVPDAVTLASLPPSAILPLLDRVGRETDYLCQVGYPHMTKAESSAYLVALWDQADELSRDLVRRARQERTVSMPEEAVSFNGYLTPSTDVIRARLDLPTFIARNIGPRPVGFRRVGDLLVCPCPLPDGTGIDDWMWVDPVAQTFHCTGCGAWGDVFAFAHAYYGLRCEALWAFLGSEAGLTVESWSTDE